MPEFRSLLALSHNNLGLVLSGTGKPAEAEAEYRAALAIFQKLADDNPAVPDFRRRLSHIHYNLGSLLWTGKLAEAEAEFRTKRRARLDMARPTTTPPTPNSATVWPSATIPSAPFCWRQASLPRPRPSIARR